MLTVISFGAGQDTIYFVWRIIVDFEFRKRHIPEEFIIVGSDTGAEHPHTYEAIKHVQMFALMNQIPFFWITPDMGFHPKTWLSLYHQYKKNNSIGSAAFRQTCTDNLKVKVVDNFVEWFIKSNYGYTSNRKKAYYEFHRDYGTIRLILGFAAKEESRTSNGNKFDPKWKKIAIERYYPLIVDGTDRQAAIDWNEANIPFKVYPSNCIICFYSSDQEILWLYRNYPKEWYNWVAMEKAKLDKYNTSDKNYGVYGKITLPEKLAKAEKLYGHWTNEQLDEYKYSHGHCIKSKY
jgi:hypothetical protein